MLRFGGNLTGYNVLTYITRSADNVLIGSVLGAAQLGVYSKAYGLLMMPVRQISSPLGSVVLPALCRLRGEAEAYRRYFARALEVLTYCSMPLVVFAFVEAEQLVMLVLGAQWEAAVPVFRWLAPATLIGIMSPVPDWLCSSLGTTRKLFRWAICATPLTVGAFCFGLRWGVVGVAGAFSVAWCVLFGALVVYCCRGTHIRVREVAYRMWHPAACSAMAGVLARSATDIANPSSLAGHVLISATVFGAFYSALCATHPFGRHSLRMVFALCPWQKSR
jgi:PST family polysaccharide transporter